MHVSQGQPGDDALADDGPRPWYLGAGAAPVPSPSEGEPSTTGQTAAVIAPAAQSAAPVEVTPWTMPEPRVPAAAPAPETEPSWSSPAPAPAPSWEAAPVASSTPAGQPPAGPSAPAHMAPVAPSPAPPGVGVRKAGQNRGLLLGALALVLVLAVGGGVGWLIRGQGTETKQAATVDTPTAAAPSEVTTQEPQSATPSLETPSPSAAPTTVDPLSSEQAALAELGNLRTESLQGLQLDGRWVAQLASKSVGITDPLQTAHNGSHTFYAVDILAESDTARATVPSSNRVLVLSSTDFGKYSTAPDGQPYWVTLVDGGFTSSDAVKAWCAATYPSLDPTSLNNACAPRTLSPSHS